MFNEVVQLIGVFVIRPLHGAVFLWRDDGVHALCSRLFENRIGCHSLCSQSDDRHPALQLGGQPACNPLRDLVYQEL